MRDDPTQNTKERKVVGDAKTSGLLTVQEVAERLRISRTAAYALCREPGFPAAWVGGQIRVPADALERWIVAQWSGGEGSA